MDIESIKKLLNERQMTFEDLANKMAYRIHNRLKNA